MNFVSDTEVVGWSETAKVGGGELIGAFARETTGTLTLRYYVNNDSAYEDEDNTTHGSQTLDYSGGGTSQSFSYATSRKSYAHIAVTLTYGYNDRTITVVDGEAGHSVVKF